MMQGKVRVDFAAVRAKSTQAEWHEMPYGIRMKLRPMMGLTAAAIEGQIAADLSAFYAGEDVIGRYGYDPADVGLLADPAIVKGWSRMHMACVRASALVEEWNLIDSDGAPIEISEPNIQQLFQLGPLPGSGGVLMSAFNRIVDAPRQRIDAEKKGSPPSRDGDTAAGLNSAGDAAKTETPAPPAGA